MKVYFDVCCLNRMFDDQTQGKIRLEAEAIVGILKRCSAGEWELVGSDIIELETSKNPDAIKKQKVSRLHDGATIKINYNTEIKARAVKLREHGVKFFDSLHLASAEYVNVDVFLTTDKQLINSSIRANVKIRVENPLNFYMEVLNNG